jgi:hypothetical protein
MHTYKDFYVTENFENFLELESNFLDFATVALSFVCDKYCSIIN